MSYLCKITTSRAPASSQITFSSSVVFFFPPQNSRKCRCGVLVVCSIHAHAQHLMHLRQSGLHVFSFDFPCPTSRFGKTKLWVVVNLNSRKCRCGVLVVFSVHAHVQHLMHLRQSDLHVFSFFFHVPLQGSGKQNCGWWYRLSNSISSVLPFSLPTARLRKI